MVRPILRQRLSEILVAKIHELIVQKRLNPGDRLPTEQEMAKQFGVSRLAVREATKALGFLGIIESSPRRGLTVGGVAFERVIPLLRIHPGSRNVSPDELIATRIIIETGALPHVMRRMTADQEVYNRIRAINDQMLACTSHELWIRYDIAFHKALLHESGLKTLVAFGDLLELFFHRFRENVEDPEWKSGIESHSRILEFLSKGKLFNAGEELSFHISSRTVQFRDPTA